MLLSLALLMDGIKVILTPEVLALKGIWKIAPEENCLQLGLGFGLGLG